MLEYLKKLLAKRQAKLKDLQKRNEESTDVKEVRSIGNEIAEVTEEIRGLQAQITELEAKENNPEPKKEERANGFNPSATYNVLATVPQNNATRNEEEDPRSTMEYRKAFKNYIQSGVENKEILQYEERADAEGTSADLGVLIPTTVIQSIMQEAEKIYGSLYSKVKKTNLKGGVKYPIGSFKATFKRITESTTSDRQNAGDVSGYVEFSYNIGEIRLARTLLQTILSVPVFETEFAKVVAKAYIEAMDKEIINGDASKYECEGILTEAKKKSGSRIKSENVIELTADDISDWSAWEKKFFAQIPLSMENAMSEFVLAKQTYVSNLVTMKDTTGQPIKKAGYDVTDKQYKFNEYPVNRVEKDIFKDFDSCENGEFFGMFWNPEEAYAINSNMEFTVIDYLDHETNKYIKKAIVINDGKILDPKYIYLLKKKVTA